MNHPGRRHDDETANPDADQVERFFESLPKVVKRLRRGRWQNLTLAVFTLLAFLTVAHAQERAADQDRRQAYATCQDINDNARRLNQFLDTVAMRVRQNEALTAEQRTAAVAQYQQLKQTLPVCRRP